MRVLVVTTMYPTPDLPAFGTFIKEQVDSLIDAGVDVEVLHFTLRRRLGAKGYLVQVREFHQALHAKQYDVIHAHYGLTGMVARVQAHYPLVVTFHGSDLIGRVDAQYRYTLVGNTTSLVSRVVALLATKSIVVSKELRSRIWNKSKVAVIPMGVNLSLFRPVPKQTALAQLNLSQDKKRVLFVAHPKNPIKRFDIAEAAVGLLQESGLKVELVPVFRTPHDQIPLYMNACDTLVLPSMHEGSPTVIKEALACNLPIVSVDVGDVSERIEGVNGCYLCERTPEDVADKLGQALETGQRTNGWDKIQDLSLPCIAQRVIEVYTDSLT
jgi:teichuronic acid biosynthesis glycosyltransferase TuaC